MKTGAASNNPGFIPGQENCYESSKILSLSAERKRLTFFNLFGHRKRNIIFDKNDYKKLMPHYFLKLNPSRPTFAQDMSTEERSIMLQHVAYWAELMKQDVVVVFGPVMDPKGVYGVGVVEVETEEQLKELIKNDPATSINRYEYYPMRAVMPIK